MSEFGTTSTGSTVFTEIGLASALPSQMGASALFRLFWLRIRAMVGFGLLLCVLLTFLWLAWNLLRTISLVHIVSFGSMLLAVAAMVAVSKKEQFVLSERRKLGESAQALKKVLKYQRLLLNREEQLSEMLADGGSHILEPAIRRMRVETQRLYQEQMQALERQVAEHHKFVERLDYEVRSVAELAQALEVVRQRAEGISGMITPTQGTLKRNRLANLARLKRLLAVALQESGRSDEALQSAREAVTIFERLAQEGPEISVDAMAEAVLTLATILQSAGRREDAVLLARQATEVLEQLTRREIQRVSEES